jgi:hypothetical protein
MHEQGTQILVPRFTGNRQPIVVDMDLPYRAEARINEISFANKSTAPELASFFNQAYGQLATAYAKLHYEMGMSEIACKKRKAVLTLDHIPDKMKEKGFAKSNEDVREAFLYTDEDYINLKESLAAIEATKELVYIKMNALKMALDTTRGILNGVGALPYNSHAVGPLPEDLVLPPLPPGIEHENVGPYRPTVTVPGRVVPMTTEVVPYQPSVSNQEPTYAGWGVKARK